MSHDKSWKEVEGLQMRQMSFSHGDRKGSENTHEARSQGEWHGEPEGRRDEELRLHQVQLGNRLQKGHAEAR